MTTEAREGAEAAEPDFAQMAADAIAEAVDWDVLLEALGAGEKGSLQSLIEEVRSIRADWGGTYEPCGFTTTPVQVRERLA